MACYWGRYLVVEEARGWSESSQVLHECGKGVRHDRDQDQDQDDVGVAEESSIQPHHLKEQVQVKSLE